MALRSWSDGRLPGAVLQGLAAGTILYVVMFEVLSREREREGPGLVPLAGLCLGFTAMLLLEMFGEARVLTVSSICYVRQARRNQKRTRRGEGSGGQFGSVTRMQAFQYYSINNANTW